MTGALYGGGDDWDEWNLLLVLVLFVLLRVMEQ